MTGSTQIVPFALGAGANVLTPTAYAALTSTSLGYEAGIAQSVQLNTTWRQSAFMAAALANFVASQGLTQNDDGNLTNAVANIATAFKTLVGSPNVFTGGTTTGSANAQVLATVIPATGFALNNGYSVIATAGYTNTGSTTMNIANSGVETVQKLSGSSLVNLTGGEIELGVNFTIVWNSTAGVWVLQTTPTLGALAYLNAGAGLGPDGAGNLMATTGVATGTIHDFAGSSAPTGYLLCYGQAVSRSTYATLFGVIGTTFGTGDGSTTFNLPDLRGRVIAGVDNMGGTAAGRITNSGGDAGIAESLGAAGGSQYLTSHTHTATVSDPGHAHSVTAAYYEYNGGGQAAGENGQYCPNVGLTTASANTGISVSNAATGSGGSQNVQPTIVLNKIIKT